MTRAKPIDEPALADDPASADCTGSGLISRAQSGDCEAFDRICQIHADRLLRQATALCRDPDQAADLVQETLIAAWRGLPRFNGQCRLFTWLCAIMIRRHQNTIRRRWPVLLSFLFRHQPEQADKLLADQADPGAEPGTVAEQAERAVRILRSLERLPERQRRVVYLRYYADASLEEIANAVGCSVGTVKSRLSHGLDRLRRMKSLNLEIEP